MSKDYLLKSLSLFISVFLFTGCASLGPTSYSLPEGVDTALIKVQSPQGFIVGAQTYGESQGCTGRLMLRDSDAESNSSQEYEIESNKETAITLSISEGRVYGHSCSYTLILTPKASEQYVVNTVLDLEKKICRNEFSSSFETEIKLIDSLPHGFSESSSFCAGFIGKAVKENENFETGLYHYSAAQALLYDYTPTRLTPE